MKWFRLYSEARNDAKLRSLTDAQHRVWFNLLCYASEMEERGCISAIDRELLAVECAGADTDLLNETIEKLTRLRIITAEMDYIRFCDMEGGDDDARQEWIDMRRRVSPVVFREHGSLCHYCGSLDDLTIDHKTPLSRGGTNEIANLVPACRSCNSRKHVKTEREWSR